MSLLVRQDIHCKLLEFMGIRLIVNVYLRPIVNEHSLI